MSVVVHTCVWWAGSSAVLVDVVHLVQEREARENCEAVKVGLGNQGKIVRGMCGSSCVVSLKGVVISTRRGT